MAGRTSDDDPVEAIEDRVDVVRGTLVQPQENSVKRWLILAGDRGLVAAVALLVVMMGFVVIGIVWTEPIARLLTETEIVQTLLFTLLSGTILLVSVAVSINSVVLSQELTSIGSQKEHLEESLEFRQLTKQLTKPDVSPAQPAAFLLAIVRAIRDRANELESTVQNEESEFGHQVTVFAADVREQVDAVETRLKKGEFGTSEVLLAGLDYDYSWQMYTVQQLLEQHTADLDADQQQILDDLRESLKQFTTGREYFKSLYFKRELANLSRWILIVAFPTLVFLSYALLALKAQLVPDISFMGVPSIVVFTGSAYVVGLAPYTLFTAYVLRSATIAYRTLAAGPFILQGNPNYGKIDWEDQTGDD